MAAPLGARVGVPHDGVVALGLLGECLLGQLLVALAQRELGLLLPIARLGFILAVFGLQAVVLTDRFGGSLHDAVQLRLHIADGLLQCRLEGGILDRDHPFVRLPADHTTRA